MNKIKEINLEEILSSASKLKSQDKSQAEQGLVKIEQVLKEIITEKKLSKSNLIASCGS